MKLTLKDKKDTMSSLEYSLHGDTFWHSNNVWMITDFPSRDELYPISAVCLTGACAGNTNSFAITSEYESACAELIAEPQR